MTIRCNLFLVIRLYADDTIKFISGQKIHELHNELNEHFHIVSDSKQIVFECIYIYTYGIQQWIFQYRWHEYHYRWFPAHTTNSTKYVETFIAGKLSRKKYISYINNKVSKSTGIFYNYQPYPIKKETIISIYYIHWCIHILPTACMFWERHTPAPWNP